MTPHRLRQHVAGAVLLHLLAAAGLVATALPALQALVASRPPMRAGLEGALVLGALAPPVLPSLAALGLWWQRGPAAPPNGWWAAGAWLAALDSVLRAGHAVFAPAPATLGDAMQRVLSPGDPLAPLLPELASRPWLVPLGGVGLSQAAACLAFGMAWSLGHSVGGAGLAPAWRAVLAGGAAAAAGTVVVRTAGPLAFEAWVALVG